MWLLSLIHIFNDEGIARAAYGCKTPLISAVGHEIDFTILDFVADLRAPTPSAAAELATPDRREMMAKLMNISDNIHKNMQTKLEMCYNRSVSYTHLDVYKRQAVSRSLAALPRMQWAVSSVGCGY